MHTIFVINGFCLNNTAASQRCHKIRELLQSKKYVVQPVPIEWNNKTITQFVAAFSKYYLQNKTEENTILGNSFGAMVAFISAPTLVPDTIILCSLSGYFKEDLHQYDTSSLVKRFGVKRAEDFKHHSADVISKKINNLPIEIVMT